MDKSEKKQLRAAIYTRVSTDDQAREGHSLAVQRDSLMDFAKREGLQVYFTDGKSKTYEDDGHSGFLLDRPAMNQMLEDARAGKFDLILVYKMDRFSRRLRDILNIMDELESISVQFKSATEPYDTTTSAGKLMLQQLGSFAEFERNRIIERVFPGMVRGVKEGHWQGARYAPYGYSYDKQAKRLNVVEKEAELVRMIFKKYLSGLSCQKIAGELFDQKIKTRSGGLFNSSLIRKMLRNKIYIGKLVWNRNRYDKTKKTVKGLKYVKNDPSEVVEADGLHDAIVSEDIFYQAQGILDRNRKGNHIRNRKRDYPLSGVVKCAVCESPYNGVSNIKSHKTGEKRPYYRCSGRARHNIKCGNNDVQAEMLEAEVFEILNTLFSAKEVSAQRLRNLVAEQAREQATGEVSRELDRLKKQMQQCHLKQSKLTDSYLESHVSPEIFEQKMRRLREEEGELKIKVERMELQLIQKEESKDYIKRAGEIVKSTQSVQENLHPVLRRELLKLIFKQLLVKGQKVFKFELYEPFKSMYDSATEERRDQNCQRRKRSCLSRPSVAR